MNTKLVRTVAAGLLLVATMSGCGKKDDPNKARAVVETALDSWKKGEDPNHLVAGNIEFTDPDRKAGQRLLDFTIKSAVSQPQQGPRVVVVLNLQSQAGKKSTTEVAYEVILSEPIKIGRDAFHVAAQ
jgi:hypothetical protein